MRQSKGVLISAVTIALAVCWIGSCDKSGGDGETTGAQATTQAQQRAVGDPVAEAEAIFQQRCTTCHGDRGAGDGPASAGLNPSPRAFGDSEWQRATDDQHIREIIVRGGTAVSLSPAMPPNPDLRERPEVVDALVALIRTFGAAP